MRKLQNQIQTEIDASFLYKKLSEIQKEQSIKNILLRMSEIEQKHAKAFLDRLRTTTPDYQMPSPSRRAKMQFKLGKIFGYDSIISSLANIERGGALATMKNEAARGESPTGFEHTHLKIIEAVSQNEKSTINGGMLSIIEGRHKTIGGNALRAAVLGANDGLLSNMSLIMGVAGATVNNAAILVTGMAGLLAGAFSMAIGEWISVQSSRELLQKQIDLEAEELETAPDEEEKELALLYEAQGISASHAAEMAQKVMENKGNALDVLVQEELGINKNELNGSAWQAAFTSFFLFAIGAIIPVFPFFFIHGPSVVGISLGCSIVGLFFIGSIITLFTGKNLFLSGLRQMILGLLAAGATFGIGRLIGASIVG